MHTRMGRTMCAPDQEWYKQSYMSEILSAATAVTHFFFQKHQMKESVLKSE